jgi:DHA2 family multidrug resistance protein
VQEDGALPRSGLIAAGFGAHVVFQIFPWFIAITVTLATFMELLDTAIANVSLPHIAGGLAVSADESTWVLTS